MLVFSKVVVVVVYSPLNILYIWVIQIFTKIEINKKIYKLPIITNVVEFDKNVPLGGQRLFV